jgi:hypothetical protein
MDCDFLKKALIDKCKTLSLGNILGFPVRPLKNYFGEKIALYFTFLKFHVKLLIIPGIIAFIIWIWKEIDEVKGRVDAAEFKLILIGILAVIWSQIYVESWQQQERLFSLENGSEDFLEKKR